MDTSDRLNEEELRSELFEQQADNYKLRSENDKLKSLLADYENTNMPQRIAELEVNLDLARKAISEMSIREHACEEECNRLEDLVAHLKISELGWINEYGYEKGANSHLRSELTKSHKKYDRLLQDKEDYRILWEKEGQTILRLQNELKLIRGW